MQRVKCSSPLSFLCPGEILSWPTTENFACETLRFLREASRYDGAVIGFPVPFLCGRDGGHLPRIRFPEWQGISRLFSCSTGVPSSPLWKKDKHNPVCPLRILLMRTERRSDVKIKQAPSRRGNHSQATMKRIHKGKKAYFRI